MNIQKILAGACSLSLAAVSGVTAFAPTHFFTPYDYALAPAKAPKTTFHLGASLEYGASSSARDYEGHKQNVLHMYGATHDVYHMLPALEQAKYTFALAPLATSSDVTKIGMTGKFEQLDVSLRTHYQLPVNILNGQTYISAYLPLRDAKIKNVAIQLPTLSTTASAAEQSFFNDRTKDLATFNQTISTYGLNLADTSQSGVGDAVVMLSWARCFKQNKDGVKAVGLHLHGGVSLPTAKKLNADNPLSVALGNEGAFGIPFGVGLDVMMKYSLAVGADVDFLALLDHTETYRMKTDLNQTDFLLPTKGRAEKDHGLTWKFNVYAQARHFYKGLSAKVVYQYVKHDSDVLYPRTNDFNSVIVNTAHSLKEWDAHAIVMHMGWDMWKAAKDMPAHPNLSLFCKLPVGGKRVLNPTTFGGQFGLNF